MSLLSDYNKVVNSASYDMPNQMASTKVKQTKDWQEKSLDWLISNIYTQKNTKRKSADEMRSNIDLINSALNVEDVRHAFDPLSLDEEENSTNLPLKNEFYNIINPPLKTLFGEELKRRSDIRAVVVNQYALNKKDEEFNERLFSFLQQQAELEAIDEEDFQKKLQELDRFSKYDLQSAHEKMANEIIQVLSNNRQINIKRKFNDAFKSLNTIGEGIVRVGRKGKEPWLYPVDSTNFTVLGLGSSNYIHDGWAWIETEYMNPSKIVEEFNRSLSKSQIQRLLERDNSYYADNITPLTAAYIQEGGEVIIGDDKGALASNGSMMTLDGDYDDSQNWIDEAGNIRVSRAQWLSFRKIGELKYYDEEGSEQRMFVDEYYPVDITKGEEVEWFYINELWEGTKIASDIYVDIQPCEVQMRSMINPAIVRPHYVGVIQSFMNGKARCIVDDIKPYQEKFNVTMIKLNQLILQHIGKAARIDVSRIPSHMSTTEWFRWLRMFGIAFENPFEESKKGMVSGMMQQSSGGHIDLSHAEDINMQIQLLTFYETMVNKIAAIPESRQGNLSGNEGLGVSQEAIIRSSTQTEDVFQLHEDLKAFTYEILIEYTKVLWEDEKGKRQYQLDDLSNYIIDIDGSVLNEAEYGIQITNSTRIYEIENELKQLAHAAMQTGTATLSDVARMRTSSSPSEMLRTLEQAEEKRIKQQQESQQMQMEAQERQLQMQQQMELVKHQQELEKLDREYQYKIEIERMKLEDKADSDMFNAYANDDNNNGINDETELQVSELEASVDREELAIKKEIEKNKLSSNEKIEMAKLKLKEMEIKSKERIAKQNAIKSKSNKSN